MVHGWGKRQAVAVHEGFFDELPELPRVQPHKADIVWLVYGLLPDARGARFRLTLKDSVYCSFNIAMQTIIRPHPPAAEDFQKTLQERLTGG